MTNHIRETFNVWEMKICIRCELHYITECERCMWLDKKDGIERKKKQVERKRPKKIEIIHEMPIIIKTTPESEILAFINKPTS